MCDSQLIGGFLEQAGHAEAGEFEDADLIVVNSCAVTAESERKSRNMVRRMKKLYPVAKVAVCGCWTRVNEPQADTLEDVLVITDRAPKDVASKLIEYIGSEDISSDRDTVFSLPDFSHYFEDKTRASIKIQDGCNRFCTYCIIPYARGKLTSESPESICELIRSTLRRGYEEVVLTGIHVQSYRYEDMDLVDLIHYIEQETDIARLRISSIEPVAVTDRFIDLAADSRALCPHFHLSLQSGSDTVLARMHRRYTSEEYRTAVENIRKVRPEACFTTDIIVGFPGETEAEFRESLDFIKDIGFSHVHVFPYSRRQGTKAYDMPCQISNRVKHERTIELIDISEKVGAEISASFVGSVRKVIAERRLDNGLYEGYSENYLNVRFTSENDPIGRIRDVLITSSEGRDLYGRCTV